MRDIKRLPTGKECLSILRDYGTPENVICHCQAVAEVSIAIATRLVEKGWTLDVELIQAAAMLHDISRLEKNHDQVGEKYVRGLGFPQVADIIALHMHYPHFNPVDSINETDIVCLGDRLCVHDKYVGLHCRMDYIIEKSGNNPAVAKKINVYREVLSEYIQNLEVAMESTLDDLVANRELGIE